MKKGKLILIPTPLGNDPAFPLMYYHADLLYSITVFIVEELTTARRFLKKAGYSRSFDEVEFLVLNEQSAPDAAGEFLTYANAGLTVGLMSEAGLPCVADPGSSAVRLAHQFDIEVVPLPGPSSVYLALMASGANGQQFSFHGYLPIDKNARQKKILEIEKTARFSHQSQIFMETPYRNEQLVDTLLKTCKDDTLLCIACDLLSIGQYIKSRTIRQWKSMEKTAFHKRPCVYVLFF